MRITILCEDRMQRQFLEGLCRERRHRIERSDAAPPGRGAASAWVLDQFATYVKNLRAFPHEDRGLLVGIDGDNQGCAARMQRMREALVQAGMAARTPDETIAVLVPTWSIETWILRLHESIEVPEGERSDHHPGLTRLMAPMWRTLRRECSQNVVEAWFRLRDSDPLPPSLTEGRREARRLGLA